MPVVRMRLTARWSAANYDYSPSRKSVSKNEVYSHREVRRRIPILYVASQVTTRTMASDVITQALEVMTT